MIAARRLIPSSHGHGFGLVSGRERVGNEATVSTWFQAGDGLVTKQLVFGVTRFNFAARCGGVMSLSDRIHLFASRLQGNSNRRALEEARPNKSCHATRNRFAIATQPPGLARVRA